MSRWIDAEWLLGVAKLSNGTVDVDDIYNAPSIELVRCGECKYWRTRDDDTNYCVREYATDHWNADDCYSYEEREGE